jgi:hypothetical protein
MNKYGLLINSLSIFTGVIVFIISSYLISLISSERDSEYFVWVCVIIVIFLTRESYRLVKKSLVKYFILNKPAEFEKLLDWERKRDQPPKKKYNYRQKSDGEGSPWIGVILQIIVGLAVIWLLFFNH